jgi:hypothetical protein
MASASCAFRAPRADVAIRHSAAERVRASCCVLVELDALVAAWLGVTADQLVAIYRSRYPVLSDYQAETWFDGIGRKIARNHNTYGHGQTKEHYEHLLTFQKKERPEPPEGYTAPFYKADRETEMRVAHTYFSARLQDAVAKGQRTPPAR